MNTNWGIHEQCKDIMHNRERAANAKALMYENRELAFRNLKR
jgi:hypothetical protein